MNKYFEQNKFVGDEPFDLHNCLMKTVGNVASNLFFHEAIDHMESEVHRIILAKSAFSLIAICEAILDRVDEDEREAAFIYVCDKVKPIDLGSTFEQMLDTIRKDLLK